jgi:uncharacterized protein (UPF0261 family)
MNDTATVAVVGTFDSKAEEHLFLKNAVEQRGLKALTINIGTKAPPGFEPDYDLRPMGQPERDMAVQAVIEAGRNLVKDLFDSGRINGIVSAGGGTGTHLGTSIMKVLPLGVPKVMVSTVASRDMGPTVGTRDITMMHSVGDLLGVNSLSGLILDSAAGAVCGMVRSSWRTEKNKKRVALTMFGFITRSAEMVREHLEAMGHEVIAFHANGTGGLSMEELASEGWFDGILDLATHELADSLNSGGYCRLIGPGRLEPLPGRGVPRLVVPGGLDCIVLEFTRNSVPEEFRDRRIFYYDFRSAIGLNLDESMILADQLVDKLNRTTSPVQVLVPTKGWSEASSDQGPLYDPILGNALIDTLKKKLNSTIRIRETAHHILDPEFAETAAQIMDEMM